MKKLLALIAAVIMLATMLITPLTAGAVTFNEDTLKLKPGTTHSSSPQYSLAWLDKLIIRDDATSVTAAKVIPKPDYPYDATYDEFVCDVNEYEILNELNENSLNASFETAIKAFYYIVVAMGMTADFDTMYSFVSDSGIRLPSEMTATEKMELAVVYAAIKYDAVYVLYDKKVSFTKGITLDEASAVILSELGGFQIPSSVKSVSGLSLYFMKDYVEESGKVPLSDNPDMDELFYWIRAITASKKGYKVPLVMFEETSNAQREYVDYAYYATIFDTLYDVEINPLELAIADSKGDTIAIPRLILTTMLDESKVSYDENMACEKLFDLACQNGWFDIDEEFYSDIYNYDIYVPRTCEKLWFTPFSLADQIGGELKYVTINLAGKTVAPATTSFAKLTPSKDKETVKIEVTYDDDQKAAEKVTYKFNVYKTEGSKSENESNILTKVGDAIGTAIPSDNEKVNAILDDVKEQVSGAVSQAVQITDQNNINKDIISTYPDEEITKADSTDYSQQDLFGLGYLSDLVDATYNTQSYQYITDGNASSDNTSIVAKTVEAIKENPEYVAAPTSLITFAGIAGFLFTKKRKNAVSVNEETNDTEI